jgi:hypothetical protein
MAGPIPQVTPEQLQTVMFLVGQKGTDITTVLRQWWPNLSPDEMAALVQRTISAIEQSAVAGPRPEAIQALERLAPQFPKIVDSLRSLANVGGQNAQEAFEALRRLARTNPDEVIPALRELVRVGGAYAEAAFNEIAALAEEGYQTARDALVKIANSGGQFAAAALALARRLGLMALEGAATVAAGISTATLIGVGAVVAGAILIGGYIWSRGEAPVQPGPRGTGENCPEQTRTARKCPWTPDGYTIGECTPGFCWDGGPQGTLACKQENTKVPNAHLNDMNNLVCNDGFGSQVRDPCTGVLLRCD